MKKLICFILACTFFIFAGCASNTETEEKNIKTEESKETVPEFLYNRNWSNYDEGCTEEIAFAKNGEFAYYCGCGSPVGDYDLYDRYEYNAETNTITLLGSDGETEEVKLIYVDEHYLCLDFENNGLQIFLDWDFKYDEFAPHSDMDIYADNGWMMLYFLEYSGNTITVAPFDYDGDARESFEEYITELPLTEDAKFECTFTTVTKGEVQTETSVIPEEELKYLGEYYTGGYLHINEDGMVDSVMVYGKTEIF